MTAFFFSKAYYGGQVDIYRLWKGSGTLNYLEKILACLPERAKRAIASFLSRVPENKITEVRLRANAPCSVTYDGKNVYLFGGTQVILGEDEIRSAVARLCEESLHTYGESMKNGYITLGDGMRIGVCGRAVCDGEKILGLREVTSLSIRVPHIFKGVSDEVMPLICGGERIQSALFYSPPGVGKTTIIRDIAMRLGGGTKKFRVCVVDTRSEIYIKGFFANSLCDFLDGYPKGVGIEIATRTFSPQAVICDEIGDSLEAQAMLSAQNSGVPLIATAHGADISSLMLRPNIKILHDAGVFRYYIGMRREDGSEKYIFTVTDTMRRLE